MNHTQDLLTRVLASLKHLHTLHGPCDDSPSGDGKSCSHAAVIVELENLLFTEPSPQPDNRICRICDGGPGNEGVCLCGAKVWEEDPPFQAVAPFPLSHDPHDLASAMLSAMATGGTIHTAFPRLCAACGAEIPATEHPDTNLCGRCAQ